MIFGMGYGHGFSYSIEDGRVIMDRRDAPPAAIRPYDPDLLYVECRACGKPVVWEPGRTGSLIAASGIDSSLFDEHCLLLSDGCPACRPGGAHFNLHLVRLATLSSPELLLIGDCQGQA
jgi:hypothetical protein